MTGGLVLGGLFGLALCGLAVALHPPRPRLATTAARWSRRQQRGAALDQIRGGRSFDGIRARADELLAWVGLRIPYRRADLELTERSLQQHVATKITLGVAGLLVPTTAVALLSVSGSGTSLAVPAVVGLVAGAVMFWLPDLWLTRSAAARRYDLRRALACYLDLVSMCLAGGRGVPEALPSAARIGSGWAFSLLRDTVERARYSGTTPWLSLAELGERVDLPELVDLGGSLQLVADDGAKVRASLSARASTQRRRQLAETEGEAAKANQSIQMAQVVLALGFFLFLGFPAVVAVMGV